MLPIHDNPFSRFSPDLLNVGELVLLYIIKQELSNRRHEHLAARSRLMVIKSIGGRRLVDLLVGIFVDVTSCQI